MGGGLSLQLVIDFIGLGHGFGQQSPCLAQLVIDIEQLVFQKVFFWRGPWLDYRWLQTTSTWGLLDLKLFIVHPESAGRRQPALEEGPCGEAVVICGERACDLMP